MSTIQATNLKSALSTTNNAIMTAGGDFTNAAGISYMGGSNKNLLINGDMKIFQRSASVAGITSGGYSTVDRWNVVNQESSVWTQTVENDAPSGSGFSKSLKMLCTTADASLGASTITIFRQMIEGQDVQRLAYGTASAKQLTMSFWVKSNVTGTYVVYLGQPTNARFIAANYTISSSNTWEYKTLSFVGDSVQTIANDNGAQFSVNFGLAAGSSYSSTPILSTWSTTITNLLGGQINVGAAINNYWQVTGVQLEIGPVATSFEFEPYETTLRKCQRYYFISGTGYTNAWTGIGGASSTVAVQGRFPTTMRAAPIISIKRPSDQANNAHRRERSVISATSYTNDEAFTTLSVPDVGVNGFPYYATSGGTAPTVGAFYMFICEANAEL